MRNALSLTLHILDARRHMCQGERATTCRTRKSNKFGVKLYCGRIRGPIIFRRQIGLRGQHTLRLVDDDGLRVLWRRIYDL